MKRILLILAFYTFSGGISFGQSFSIEDLVTLTSLSSKSRERFLAKNKFAVSRDVSGRDKDAVLFNQKIRGNRKDIEPVRTIETYKSGDIACYILRTSSKTEHLSGQAMLRKDGFFYDIHKDNNTAGEVFYQKRNITITTSIEMDDEIPVYAFTLEVKDLPDLSNIRYAEDLLQFNSHEYLASFFGPHNVKKDMYYFSEKELKKCSVLFFGSNKQVVFVWNDETNLKNIEYLLVSTKIPTQASAESDKELSTNEWKLRNGIQHGTNIKDLLKINENDFTVYGNPSEFSFMIQPVNNGNIDFTKTALLLICKGCRTDTIFDKPLVSALDIAKKDLPVSVFDIVIYPHGAADKSTDGVVKK